MHSDSCVACEGEGVKPRRAERHQYRYFVFVRHQVWSLIDEEIEEAHGPFPNDRYLPAGLKYAVARSPAGSYGEIIRSGPDDATEVLTSCGRFTKEWHQGRTFASDREADRTVERLASGLPVFITRAIAVAATVGVAVPAWISALVMLWQACD